MVALESPVRITVWTLPGVKVELSQDDWLVEAHSNLLRTVVVDGVTPWETTGPVGEDAAIYAAGMVRTALRSTLSPHEALLSAHRLLWDSSVTPTRRAFSASAAVADIRAHEGRLSVDAASAADCDVWTRAAEGAGWQRLTGRDALTPDARNAWEAFKQDNPTLSGDALLAREAVFLDDPKCRPYPAVGRQDPLTLDRGSRVGCTEVLLCSDGARIAHDTIREGTSRERLDAHMARLASGNHGDATLILITL